MSPTFYLDSSLCDLFACIAFATQAKSKLSSTLHICSCTYCIFSSAGCSSPVLLLVGTSGECDVASSLDEAKMVSILLSNLFFSLLYRRDQFGIHNDV